MAMLAGPRHKQKVINLRAKNSAWSNDSNKFGQKMLEKMGWSEGKGLGANENGIKEHVIAKYKNDEKGLGYKDKNDQWTKHEDDFNALLANLSQDSKTETKLHSGTSLEKKSKSSQSRLHYKKFTRGKDISRYSEKELANIFGKKSLKVVEPIVECEKQDVKITEQVFTDGGNMNDYFKNKIIKKKKIENCDRMLFFEEGEEEAQHCGFGFKPDDESSVPDNSQTEVVETVINTDNDDNFVGVGAISVKDKKKSKKRKKQGDITIEIVNEMVEDTTELNKEVKKKKKSKKQSTLIHTENKYLEENEVLPIATEIVNKKSKNKRKHKEIL